MQTQTEMKKETKSSDQKSAKNDTKDAALEKKTDTKKENVKKEDTKSEKAVEQKETTAKKSESADNKSTEKQIKRRDKNGERIGETDSKPSNQSESKPEQKPESKPEQKPSQPESKPEKPQHTHTWQEKTHTVNHSEVGHNEQYVVKEAWTETVTEDVYDPWECCNVCGADCTADPSGHMKQHALAGEGGGRHTEYYKTVTRTVEHPAEYGTRYVVDTPAWTETVSDGFFCIGCGAKK